MSSCNDVLLVTLDSCRSDHIGCLGDEEGLTPHIDDFAAQATSYRSAMAHGPSTYLSFPSILGTGHALANPDFPFLDRPTVQEHLCSQGFHTAAAIASNAWLSPAYDYDRGFDEFHALGRGPRAADSWWDRVRHRVGDTLGNGVLFRVAKGSYNRFRDLDTDDRTEEEKLHDLAVDHVSRDEPTFTWIHYMTTHAPYVPDPTRERRRFLAEPPKEKAQRDLIERAREHPEDISQSERELLSKLYREAVVHVDRRVGELLDKINLDQTAVVLAADHGEAFWEHGYYEHPPELHRELLDVPLIVSDPDSEGGETVNKPVGLEMIPRTLCDLAGTETFGPRSDDLDQRLFAAVAHESQWEPQDSKAESLQIAVRDGDWKYIYRANGNDELFNLADDYSETTSRKDDFEGIAADLRAAAVSFGETLSIEGEVTVPEELQEQLRDLGYLR